MAKEGKKRVLIGMSGGVDSSVAAYLLKKQGFEVSGVFLRLWKSSKEGYREDQNNLTDAKKVAQKLDIKFQTLDLRKKFKETVVQYFLDEYQKGRTPNPCIFCNKNFKFRFILEEMKKQGADFVATGHYALKRERKTKNEKRRIYSLIGARDKNKDQSYFLYTLNQKELSKIIFPLGEMTKVEVRKIAKDLGLDVSRKKESQDICFLGDVEVMSFLQKNLKLKKGKIINETGKVLGEHDGLSLYTLGQRKGVGVGGEGPYFVFEKDYRKNILKVSNNREQKIFEDRIFFLENPNWIIEEPKIGEKLLVSLRYRKKLVSAIIKKSEKGSQVFLEEPQKSITPGQSAVFYDGEGQVLGGGIIKK